ncbi:MAG: pilus assembly protein [Leptothrix sp. (in: b-proteobacteria)]
MLFKRFLMTPLPASRHAAMALLGAGALAVTSTGWAAQVTVSNVPLATLSVAAAKPNIMFILDNSGSMASDYMPDDMSDNTLFGFYAAQCNGLAYNPLTTYTPPVTVNATTGAISLYVNASFTNALSDGFDTTSSKSSLANSFYYNYRNAAYTANPGTGTQKPLDWTYDSSGNVVTTTDFYKECFTRTSATSGSGFGKFDKITVTSTSSDAQNYANWYSYYRTRRLAMRSSAGRAFADLSDSYRVGFTVISDTGINETTNGFFLNTRDFVSSQKNTFLTKLYTATGSSNTPLRGSLSKVGRYFAKAISGQSYEPAQYSCQRNFAILSTDGYWNTGSESGSYGPLNLTGTSVGQQDGDEVPPMRDATTQTYTKTTTTVSTAPRVDTTPLQLQRTSSALSGTALSAASGCTLLSPFKLTTQTQVCSPDQTAVKSDAYTVTTTTTQIDTVVNGVTTPGTPSSVNSAALTGTSTAPAAASVTCSSGTWVNSGAPSASSCLSLLNLNALLASLGLGSAGSSSTPALVAGATLTGTPGTSTQVSSNTTTSATTTSNGPTNTLADVAEYYWKTDLRTTGTLSANNVPATDDDPATWQHMSTYSIGLGVKGTLGYDRDYLSGNSADFNALSAGTKNWPSPSVSTSGGDARNIDDLWHAAVNGRGQYFSASDPNQLDDAIATTLASITRISGSGGAAGASSLTPVAGDDWLFLPTFTSVVWTGDVRAYKFTFDPVTQDPIVPDTSAGKPFVWSAADKLAARTDARRILFNKSGVLDTFTYANLSTAGKSSVFDTRCTRSTPADNLSQCASITTNAKAKVTGTNLVSYLAGDGSLEIGGSVIDNRVFRNRNSLLGDLVGAAPVYVGKPPFRYADVGYASYASANVNRRRMVYVAANDGMLHAFNVGSSATDATGGAERWAFVPSAAMTEMWRLADKAYGTNHRYYVDATPTVADVYDSSTSSWRTILVGGLGAGGRSYYALDITDPEADPKLLWEVSNTTSGLDNLGLTFGNPIITKNKAGTWVVAFSSGTNNVGDGVGRLYIVNAMTGALISTVATSAGDSGTPSNLGRLNAWIDSDTDNTAQRFYAGDMLGNLWRFDHDDRIPPSGNEALLLGVTQAPDGTTQPIVGKPVLSEISVSGVKTPIISFATGRLLNPSDLSDTTVQTIYSVKDGMLATGLGVLRSTAAKLVQQTLAANRTLTTLQPVDWTLKNGWYLDLNAVSGSKERVNVDGEQLAGGVLAFASTLPTSDACGQGGSSILYKFDLSNGNVLGADSYTTMIVGLGRLASATSGKVSAIVTTSDSKITLSGGPNPTVLPPGTAKRSSWRELSE